MRDDLKQLMQYNFVQYASYVILDRAIPCVDDGLKPVQRRILHTLQKMDDGKFHKVANVSGQTMAYHPHGDAAINDALVNLACKDYLLEKQGNFGNILTGDPAAASRYIETRLSPLARETLFNKELTEYVLSYDGRNQEPVTLPAKIPVLLMQGAEGIAVGMSTRILPHNFVELLEAQIALLQGEPVELLPDFITGGIMDASDYDKGKGKVRLRAKLEIPDDKTIVIREICYGTTTDSVTRSIDEAAKRGKIRIDSINDYTAEKVEIEIKLPRGHYAKDLVESLYAFTDCEVSLSSQVIVIRDDYPWQTDVHQVLEHNTNQLQHYIKRELEIERDVLQEKIFAKTLERIFIENRLYKKIEEEKSYEAVHDAIAKALKPHHKNLLRVPTRDDREKLLGIPIRKISRFDINKNIEEVEALEGRFDQVEKDLKRIKAVTIKYLKGLIKQYGAAFPRRTRIGEIEQVDRKKIEEKTVQVGFDPKKGFLGLNVKSDSPLECSNLDRLLIMFADGSYKVINIPEKEFVHDNDQKVVYVGVADKKTEISVLYQNPKTKQVHGKRFVVSKFILDKEYRFIEEDMKLEYLTTVPEVILDLQFVPAPRQKVGSVQINTKDLPVKGVTARGIRLSPKEVKKVKPAKKQPELWDLANN